MIGILEILLIPLSVRKKEKRRMLEAVLELLK